MPTLRVWCLYRYLVHAALFLEALPEEDFVVAKAERPGDRAQLQVVHHLLPRSRSVLPTGHNKPKSYAGFLSRIATTELELKTRILLKNHGLISQCELHRNRILLTSNFLVSGSLMTVAKLRV
jgi:hypothetical protein